MKNIQIAADFSAVFFIQNALVSWTIYEEDRTGNRGAVT